VAKLVEALRYNAVAVSILDGVTGIFHWQSFRPHYGPGADSASNRNEYQEYSLGGKGGRCVGLTTLLPSYVDSLEIWASQPPAYIAIVLPLPLLFPPILLNCL